MDSILTYFACTLSTTRSVPEILDIRSWIWNDNIFQLGFREASKHMRRSERQRGCKGHGSCSQTIGLSLAIYRLNPANGHHPPTCKPCCCGIVLLLLQLPLLLLVPPTPAPPTTTPPPTTPATNAAAATTSTTATSTTTTTTAAPAAAAAATTTTTTTSRYTVGR